MARIAVALLSLVLLVGSSPVVALAPGAVGPEDGLRVAIDAMRQLATDSRNNKRQKQTTRPSKGLPVKLGRDGRLTLLLIGSDWRPDAGGERLDVVMVATVDPTTGQAAVVSIPRDTAGIPLADGSNSGGMRVNAIYYIRYRDPSLGHGAVDRKALKRFSQDIGAFLGTEIDYWAMTRFASFANLINSLGGVRVDVEKEVTDSSYHHHNTRGIWFPVKKDYMLKGDPHCKPKPKRCHSALVFARSRHGTYGDTFNSDWARAERQQEIVRAAVKDVLEDEGAGIRLLGTLLNVRDKIDTDIPKTTEAAAQLYALLDGVKLPRSNMKVLAPATWAGLAADGTTRPNLSRIRDWVDKHFYKVRARRS